MLFRSAIVTSVYSRDAAGAAGAGVAAAAFCGEAARRFPRASPQTPRPSALPIPAADFSYSLKLFHIIILLLEIIVKNRDCRKKSVLLV